MNGQMNPDTWNSFHIFTYTHVSPSSDNSTGWQDRTGQVGKPPAQGTLAPPHQSLGTWQRLGL